MTFCLMRPNCRNKSLNHVRLYLRLRGFIDNLRASNLDISVRIWAEEPRRFYGSPGGGVALKKHLTKPPEFRGSLFPKGAQCLMSQDQGGAKLQTLLLNNCRQRLWLECFTLRSLTLLSLWPMSRKLSTYRLLRHMWGSLLAMSDWNWKII